MLVDLQLDEVLAGRAVAGPDLPLREPDPIKHPPRLAVEAVGELLRIGKAAADALDLAFLAADIGGRAPVAGRIGGLDADAVADLEAPLRRRRVGARGRPGSRPRSHNACEPP